MWQLESDFSRGHSCGRIVLVSSSCTGTAYTISVSKTTSWTKILSNIGSDNGDAEIGEK